jgi:hypothetical protein
MLVNPTLKRRIMRMIVTLTGVLDEPRRNADGSWDIEIAAREITPGEHEVLSALFPDLESAVGRLLGKQAILNAIK